MQRRVGLFVFAILAIAGGATAWLAQMQEPQPQEWLIALLCMVGWGLISQVLGERIGRASLGSIASIPYLAAVILVPRIEVVIGIAAAEVVVGLVRRQHVVKLVFNVGQLAFAAALTALLFSLLGGKSLLNGGANHFLPYGIAAVVFFIANTVCVSGVIAVSEGRPLLPVWYANTKGSALNNLLAIPLPYLFAQLFVSRGVLGALLLVIPLLAVRHVFRTAWQLETATQDLLQLMVKAIEARDPYTSGHSQRVQEYALIIGRAIGLSTRALDRLGRAALLHDVGKIHEVYAPILRKPEKLTPAERALMQTHPVKSAELVSAVSHLKDVVPSIRHHHENWDGSGYPDGLRAEEIPLFARIIAIADTVDAMTTDRSYRRALTTEAVRQELAIQQGRQFDPTLCAAILSKAQFDRLSAAVKLNGGSAASMPEAVRRAV